MASDEQRARRRAQRETAKRLQAGRNYQPVIPRAIRGAALRGRQSYADRVIAGKENMPVMGTAESKNLASIASKAAHGKADKKYEKHFSKYWYKHKEIKDREI